MEFKSEFNCQPVPDGRHAYANVLLTAANTLILFTHWFNHSSWSGNWNFYFDEGFEAVIRDSLFTVTVHQFVSASPIQRAARDSSSSSVGCEPKRLRAATVELHSSFAKWSKKKKKKRKNLCLHALILQQCHCSGIEDPHCTSIQFTELPKKALKCDKI